VALSGEEENKGLGLKEQALGLRRAKGKEVIEAHQDKIGSLEITYSRWIQSKQPVQLEVMSGELGEMEKHIQRVKMTTMEVDIEPETINIGFGSLGVIVVR
jgi:hypothetical protein